MAYSQEQLTQTQAELDKQMELAPKYIRDTYNMDKNKYATDALDKINSGINKENFMFKNI